jgi:hypothetical protein
MGTDRLTVMFCCNDRHGNLLDVVDSVEVGDLIQIEGPMMFSEILSEVVGTTTIAWTLRTVEVAGAEFRYYDRGRHAGNLCWDAVAMDRAEVARLLNHLRTIGGWTCLSAEASLAEVWGNREITVDDLERASGA